MRLFFYLGTTILLVLAVGCKKDVSEGVISSPDTFFNQNEENAKQVFIIDATIFNSIEGAQGTLVRISPNSFVDASGNLVTGNVQVYLIEVYDRTTRVLLNKMTQGVRSSGELDLLKSGGQYSLKASQDGEQVFLAEPIVVNLPTDNTGGFNPEMKKFGGNLNIDNQIVWEIAPDSSIVLDTVTAELSNFPVYQIYDEGNWDWVNCDYWWNDPRPKTEGSVSLPSAFDGFNTAVVLSIDGEPMVMARLGYTNQEVFTTWNIPVGLECHFIALTMIDDVLHYAIQGNTIEENHVEMITDFLPTTQSELADMIDNLP